MKPLRVVLATAIGLGSFLPIATAQAPVAVPHDDQASRYVNFEVGPVRSVAYDAAADRLLVLNQPGGRLVVFDPSTLARRAEIPIGLGAASIALRPGTNEAWIVDRVYGAVLVVDVDRRAVVRTIRVEAEPHGIAFSPDGQRAWVACSASDTVVSIDAAAYAVAGSLAIPADAPRGIAFHRGRAWVASFLSGNGTSARGSASNPTAATEIASTDGPGLVPLPDLDVFPIRPGPQPGADVVEVASARSGAGTVLFDVVARPGTPEIWIPGTEGLNAEHRGEASFVGGQVVSNRIAIHAVDGSAPPRVVDLDALAPPGVGCAQPTSLAFDPVRSRAYVCAYGSDLVAVLDIGAGGAVTWAGHVAIPAKQIYPRGSGPRSCVVDPQGENLWVFNRNDGAVVRIRLANLPVTPNFAVTSAIPVSVGFDAQSDEIMLGRHLFSDARNSASKTSSCASCHVDGNTDGLVWELSTYLEPEGTPLAETLSALDPKGPLFTQGTRRQEESGPYHWRGERRSVNDFADSFTTLLDRRGADGELEDLGGDFQYLRHYVNRIAIPANPQQARDRTLRPDEAEGYRLFRDKPVLGALTCMACHALPLGSSGEIATNGVAGVSRSYDVPGLRGVGDREQPAHHVGGAFGTRPRSGAGLSHAGVYSRLQDVYARTPTGAGDTHAFALTPDEADKIAAFLRAFDTGLAPATATMVTAHAGNWAAARDGDVAFLVEQAKKGNCDLVALRSQRAGLDSPAFVVTAAYDVARGRFRLASGPFAETSLSALLLEAANDRPVTFLGVPLGMGLTVGLDRDCDGLNDHDELQRGTNPDDDDTDGDRFPDGYEVSHGANPLVPNATVVDTTTPALVGPVRVVYATTNTVKVEFDTSEACRVHVALNGGSALQRLPLGHKGDVRHYVVIGALEPDTEYVLDLVLRDPANNVRTDSTTRIRTAPRRLAQPSYVADLRLAIAWTGPTLRAEVDVASAGAPVGPGYVARGSVYRLSLGSIVPELVASSVQGMTAANGTALVQAPLGAQPTVPGVLFFVLTDVVAPVGGAAYARAFSTEVFDSIAY